MGVPAFYRWLSEKYPRIVSDVVEDRVRLVDGSDLTGSSVRAPFDSTRPNPSGLEADNLYVDMNGIIHPCSHPEHGPQPKTEEEMYENVCRYVDRLFRAVRPRKLLFLAIDGVAPRAKMNQQRSRRFRAAQEARERREVEASVRKKMIEIGTMPVEEEPGDEPPWDSNVITPGTDFMLRLSEHVRFYVRKRISSDPAWGTIKVLFSDASVPGEGEHKIMDHVRRQRCQPGYDPNLVHVLHGLDADLIMLALATHEAHFYVLREEVLFGRRSQEETERRREESGYADAQRQLDEDAGPIAMELPENKNKPLQRISVPILREYLRHEFAVCESVPFRGEVSFERVVDDVVFLCFFVGNDFLPHLPSLDIRDGALDFLFNVYKRLLPTLGSYVTSHGGEVNLSAVDVILAEVGSIEDVVFEMKHENERREKRRREEGLRRRRRGGAIESREKNGAVVVVAAAATPREVSEPPRVLGRAARILEQRKLLDGEGDDNGGGDKTATSKRETAAVPLGKRRSRGGSGKDGRRSSLKYRATGDADDGDGGPSATMATMASAGGKKTGGRTEEENAGAAARLRASLLLLGNGDGEGVGRKDDDDDGEEEEREWNGDGEVTGSSERRTVEKKAKRRVSDDGGGEGDAKEEERNEAKASRTRRTTTTPSKRKIDTVDLTEDDDDDDNNKEGDDKGGVEDEESDDMKDMFGDSDDDDDNNGDDENGDGGDDEENNEGSVDREALDEAARALKEKVKNAEREKLDAYARNVEDKVRLHEPGWKDRYYSDKCKADDVSAHGGREHLFRSYVVGLCWVMKYYYDGCPSWKWYYPFHYAPFASDLKNVERFDRDRKSFVLGEPFKPVEQLLGVLPNDSNAAVPKPCRWLMGDVESPILDFYPRDVPCDPNGKAMPWLWVVLLPFIDEERLLAAMRPTVKKWSPRELLCNERGLDDGYLYVHASHPLAAVLSPVLRSSSVDRKGKPKKTDIARAVISRGLTKPSAKGFFGSIRRPPSDEAVPADGGDDGGASVDPPRGRPSDAGGGGGGDGDGDDGGGGGGLFVDPIEPNRALCVAFSEPKKLPHRSVLPRGAAPPPATLTEEDRRTRRPRLNRGGGTIANMGTRPGFGGGGSGASHRGGYGSMNVGSYERDLARRTGRGNEMDRTGTRPWGAMEPAPKRRRFDGGGGGGGGGGGYGVPPPAPLARRGRQQQQQPAYHPNPFRQGYDAPGAPVAQGAPVDWRGAAAAPPPRWQAPPPNFAQPPPPAQTQQQHRSYSRQTRQQQPHRAASHPPHATTTMTTTTQSYQGYSISGAPRPSRPQPQLPQLQPPPQQRSSGFVFNRQGGQRGGGPGHQPPQQQLRQQQQPQPPPSRPGVNANLMSSLRSQLANTLQRNRRGGGGGGVGGQ